MRFELNFYFHILPMSCCLVDKSEMQKYKNDNIIIRYEGGVRKLQLLCSGMIYVKFMKNMKSSLGIKQY